jgi:hypothetical protein
MTPCRHFLAEEAVGDLHQHARAIAHQRVGADGAAMRQVFQHEQAVLDDLVRLLALHMLTMKPTPQASVLAQLRGGWRKVRHRLPSC